MDPVKGSIGVAAGAVIVGGTAFGVYSSMDPMPECDVLSGMNNFSDNNDYQSGKYGFAYGDYLVDPDKLSEPKNKDWWEWSFRLLGKQDKTKIKKQFAGVSKAFDSTDTKALNQICKNAYKANKTDVTDNAQDTETNKYLEADVWKFCSISSNGTKPILLNKSGNTEDQKLVGTSADNSNKWGKKKEDVLVSTRVESNNWFWELKEKQFRSASSVVTNETNNIFKALKENSNGTVKATCQRAYDMDSSSSATSVKEADLKAYCYLEKSSS
ncbi:hypothetical protein [Candidatus Mycoplasma haematohominis]|uniref:hypothetical protein n=1 Tax=Candidatus Mycoplasma haematohominis TaxID=1494318 RepID=UPI001C0A67C7|nr:hypothetical protein [Candidatus Mycoplasma haemohominis]